MNIAAPQKFVAPWIKTITGAPFPLINPTADDVDWRHVAECLAKLPRFNGATPGVVYSGAQHSLMVAKLSAQAARIATTDDTARRGIELLGLLHDAHEAYINDIITPVADIIAHLSGDSDPVAALKSTIDRAVMIKAGLPWPLPAKWVQIVNAADRMALAVEVRDLMPETGPEFTNLPPTTEPRIIPITWGAAADAWSRKLHQLI